MLEISSLEKTPSVQNTVLEIFIGESELLQGRDSLDGGLPESLAFEGVIVLGDCLQKLGNSFLRFEVLPLRGVDFRLQGLAERSEDFLGHGLLQLLEEGLSFLVPGGVQEELELF